MQERRETKPTTAWMQEVESHARAQGDKADDCMDAGGRITHGAVIDDCMDAGGRITHGAVIDDCMDAGGRVSCKSAGSSCRLIHWIKR